MRTDNRLAIRLCLRFALCALSTIVSSPCGVCDDALPSRIRTLLSRRCAQCHEATHAEGKLDLTSRESFFRGGQSGSPVNVTDVNQSLIWQRVDHDEMPPRHPLSSDEKSLLHQWLSDGLPWPEGPIDPQEFTTEFRGGRDWWSLQPISQIAIPSVSTDVSHRQPIDEFILEKLTSNQLTMSAEAEPRTLIRRATFNLMGLPPSPEEVDEFLADDRPDRFERLVDRLLASPHYGERWARHWLDVVRFGESNGFERDLPRPNAWPYRDWVIESLNSDMPYDEFARMQLAGDLIADDPMDASRAVGFLVAGPHDTVLSVIDSMKATMRQDELEDLVGTISQTFLGLTLNCARCHDHRFDPVSTKEYYQFASAFAGIDPGEQDFTPPDRLKQIEDLKSRITQLSNAQQTQQVDEASRRELETLRAQVSNLSKASSNKVYTAIATQPGVMRVHRRGSVDLLDAVVSTAGLSAVQGPNPDFGLHPDAMEAHRRKSLANWITDHRNPLFTRAIVNRVWHYHFGAGLVPTPNDLGFQGGISSHPDLLDWLSSEFQSKSSRGYSLKQLHRMIVTSASYRQSSSNRKEAFAADASNRWLWRMNPKRLEAEQIRDAMLVVSGQLNPEIGGKGYSDFNSHFFKGTQFYDPIDLPTSSINRRTVYRMWARGGRNPLLDQFDCPDPSTTTPRRNATITPLQSLALLNNAFVLRTADHFAERLRSEQPDSTERQVERAYSLLFNRLPLDEESQASIDFINRHGLIAYCRALWNASEFLFSD